MPLSDFRERRNRQSSSFGGSGLSRFAARNRQDNDSNYDRERRIDNAISRLHSVGQPIPSAKEKEDSTVLNSLFGVLNYFNNLKNRAVISGFTDKTWADTGGAGFSNQVEGDQVMQEVFGMKDEDGIGDEVAGFGFDLITDPLNLLTFGTAGAARAGATGAIKGVKLLEGATKPRYAAKLGAFGHNVEVPGSAEALDKLGNVVGKVKERAGQAIEKRPGLSEFVNRSKRTLGRTFITGYGTPETVKEVTDRAVNMIRMDSQDTVNSLVKLRKEWGKDVNDLNVIEAVENPERIDKLNQAEIRAYGDVKDFFDRFLLKGVSAGVIDDARMNYIPHIFKGSQQDIEEAMEQLRRRGAKIRTESGHNKQRTILADIKTIMNHPELSKKLKPETDLTKIMGIYQMSVQKSIRNKNMLRELTNLGPDVILHKSSGNIPNNWVKAPVRQLKDHYVPANIAAHMKDIMEPFVNNEAAENLLKHYDSVLGWWKGMATVPNPGFHIRNGLGNIFNNYLGGVRSIDSYKKATEAHKAEDLMIEDFYDLTRPAAGPPATLDQLMYNHPTPDLETFEDVVGRVFNNERFLKKITGGKGTKIEVNYMGKKHKINMAGIKLLAKMNGVTNRGFFRGDLNSQLEDQLKLLEGSRNYNPLSTKNTVFKGAERLGNTIDNNTRLAHFIAKLEEGGSIEEAAKSVKKYLFDYADLTPVEKGLFKRVIPFYAFTRNNLPLQVSELVKQPKYATLMGKFQNFADAVAEDVTGEEIGDEDLPKHLKDLYAIRLPFQSEGEDALLGIDLPIRDLNTLEILEMDTNRLVSQLTPLMSTVYEIASNRNMYFGSDIEKFEGQTVRAPGYIQGLWRAANADPNSGIAKFFNEQLSKIPQVDFKVAPSDYGGQELRMDPFMLHILNQIVTLKNIGNIADVGADAIAGKPGETRDISDLSSPLLGTTLHTSTREEREKYGNMDQLQQLEDLIRKLKDEGTNVPTMRELQQRGSGRRRSGLSGFAQRRGG